MVYSDGGHGMPSHSQHKLIANQLHKKVFVHFLAYYTAMGQINGQHYTLELLLSSYFKSPLKASLFD